MCQCERKEMEMEIMAESEGTRRPSPWAHVGSLKALMYLWGGSEPRSGPYASIVGAKGWGHVPAGCPRSHWGIPLSRVSRWQSNQPNMTCVPEAMERDVGRERLRSQE